MKPHKAFIWTLLIAIVPSPLFADRYWVGPVPWVTDHYEAPAGVIGWIDLRTAAECGTPGTVNSGVAIFVTADATNLSASYTNLGIDPERVLSTAQRNNLGTALRMPNTPSSNVLAEIIYEALTSQADPTGASRVRPIMPTNELRLEVWLAGRKIRNKLFDQAGPEAANIRTQLQAEYRAIRQRVLAGQLPANFHRKWLGFKVRQFINVPYRWFEPDDLPDESDLAPSTTITDNFNRADGAIGSSSEGWSWTAAGPATWTILSNQGVVSNTAGINTVRAESNLSSSDAVSQADLTARVPGSANRNGPAVRFDSASQTCYSFTVNSSFSQQLSKVVAGTLTILATQTTSTDLGVSTCTANGTTISGQHTGDAALSVTDGSITSGLRAGLLGRGGTFDNFQASDLSAGSAGKTWPYYYKPLGLLNLRRWSLPLSTATLYQLAP